jgi:hypothetical protein
MDTFIKSPLAWLGMAAVAVACQGTLPPTEPHVSPDGSPSMTTNDAATAGPRANEGLASPPDTLPGPGAPINAKEPVAAGGTAPIAPTPHPSPGGGVGGIGMGGRGMGGSGAAGGGIH